MSGVSGTTPDPRIEAAAKVLNDSGFDYAHGLPTPWERVDEAVKDAYRGYARVVLAAVDVGNTQPEYAPAGWRWKQPDFTRDQWHLSVLEPARKMWNTDIEELFVRVVSATPNKEANT